jgi:hypothetical protein
VAQKGPWKLKLKEIDGTALEAQGGAERALEVQKGPWKLKLKEIDGTALG